ncbi:Hypothetical protein D9617_17g046850 [Elsinoe fawcettii]|nr:Hypothetical protein D9617_17g046850 [Elsinoe fawcettii]
MSVQHVFIEPNTSTEPMIPDDFFEALEAFIEVWRTDIAGITLWTRDETAQDINNKRAEYKGEGRCSACGLRRSYDKHMATHLGKCAKARHRFGTAGHTRAPQSKYMLSGDQADYTRNIMPAQSNTIRQAQPYMSGPYTFQANGVTFQRPGGIGGPVQYQEPVMTIEDPELMAGMDAMISPQGWPGSGQGYDLINGRYGQ